MSGLDIEYEILPFSQWLFGRPAGADGAVAVPSAFWACLVTMLVLAVIGLTFAYLSATVTAIRHALQRGEKTLRAVFLGPLRAFKLLGPFLVRSAVDLATVSPRRVVALATLAVREAFRRRIWIALVVFAVTLMFAGWTLNPDSDQPSVIYLDFVMTDVRYILLPVMVLIGAFSLPLDLRNRTIHTVVTKPVRTSEIILGRMLGFIAVATILLAVMGVASYIFVSRGLDHSHTLTSGDLEEQREGGQVVGYVGTTSLDSRHRHQVALDPDQFSAELDLKAGPDGSLVVTRVGSSANAAGLAVGDLVTSIDGQDTAGLSRDAAIGKLRGRAGTTVQLQISRAGNAETIDLVRAAAETYTEPNKGHKHRVTARWDAEKQDAVYEIGPPEGLLVARVPLYGRLRFLDNQGQPKQRGISVGKIYSYRSYIQGNSLASAIWTFAGLDADEFPGGLPLDVDIRVYRSHIGEMEEGINGTLQVRNPETGLRSREFRLVVGGAQDAGSTDDTFMAKEFSVDRVTLPLKTTDQQGNAVDLFKDLVTADGQTEVWLRCLDSGQYYGMAQADVYVRARDASYPFNFFKGLFSIWLQAAVVGSLAVLCSTFLSGPIAMMLTLTVIVLGYFSDFLSSVIESVLRPERIQEIASHERYYGGGPVEAFFRLITQRNQISELDDNLLTETMKTIDKTLIRCLEALLNVIPDFGRYDEINFLSHGYYVQQPLLMQNLAMALAYLLGAYVFAYFFFKRREIGA